MYKIKEAMKVLEDLINEYREIYQNFIKTVNRVKNKVTKPY